MKKLLLVFSLLFGFCLFLKAQFKEIATGPEFNEPYGATSKFLLMKKGNLVFADVGFRDSIRIRVYNPAHQEIAVTSYAMGSSAKRKELSLREAFEIGGDAVLFITAEEEKAKVFYRVIVDPNSGKVRKEEKIFELKPQIKREDFYALSGGVFHVSKSADTDDYAILYSNNFRYDKIKKIEVALFNKEHVETGRSFFETAEKEFEYFIYCGMTVIDPEKAALVLVGYPWDEKSGDEGKRIFLAHMKKGAPSLSITSLNFPENKVPEKVLFDHDRYNNRLVVAASLGGFYKADQYLCFLDPVTGKAGKMMNFNFSDAIYEKGKDIHGKKYIFYGKPVDMVIEKNGSFSIVYEELDYESMGSNARFTHTVKLDIIVAGFDNNGKRLSNYLVPRKVYLNPPNSGTYGGGFGNQYTRFAYIKNNDKSWLFCNDLRENIQRLEKNKDPKQVVVVNDCDAFYFPLTGNDPIPSRKYLFRETDEKEEHIQSPFGVSVYDKVNDVFITLRLNRDEKNRTKTSKIVWLKPQ